MSHGHYDGGCMLPSIVRPRNQLNSQSLGRSSGRGFLLSGTGAQAEDAGKLAAELDMQLAVLGREDDGVDERANEFGGLVSIGRVVEACSQIGDLLPVELWQSRVDQRSYASGSPQ